MDVWHFHMQHHNWVLEPQQSSTSGMHNISFWIWDLRANGQPLDDCIKLCLSFGYDKLALDIWWLETVNMLWCVTFLAVSDVWNNWWVVQIPLKPWIPPIKRKLYRLAKLFLKLWDFLVRNHWDPGTSTYAYDYPPVCEDSLWWGTRIFVLH